MGDRRAGSPSAAATASYLKGRLTSFGYSVEVQEFTLPYYHVRKKSLALDGKSYPVDAITYTGGAPTGGVTAEVVRPDESWSNVKGKIALLPYADTDPGWKNLQYNMKADYKTAAEAGAVAVLAEAKDYLYALSISQTTWELGKIPGMVVLGASELVGKRPSIVLDAEITPSTGRNVIGERKGTGPESVVLIAHYDAWFGGAHDNGTGTAVLLRAAELMKSEPLTRTVTFIASDAEELGLIGAQAYVASHDLANVVGAIDLDMPSVKPSDVFEDLPLFQWRVLMTSETPALMASTEKASAANQVAGAPLSATLWKNAYGSFRTDYERLYYQGIPGLWVVSEGPYYHTTEDVLAHVDPTDLENVSAMVTDVLKDMQTMPLARITHLPVKASYRNGELSAKVSFSLDDSSVADATVTVDAYRGHAVVSRATAQPTPDGGYSLKLADLKPAGPADQLRVHATWNYLDGEAWVLIPHPVVKQTSLVGRTVSLDASGSWEEGGAITTYKWVFGDGTTAQGPRVSHTFDRLDSSSVKANLTVADARGNTQAIDFEPDQAPGSPTGSGRPLPATGAAGFAVAGAILAVAAMLRRSRAERIV